MRERGGLGSWGDWGAFVLGRISEMLEGGGDERVFVFLGRPGRGWCRCELTCTCFVVLLAVRKIMVFALFCK